MYSRRTVLSLLKTVGAGCISASFLSSSLAAVQDPPRQVLNPIHPLARRVMLPVFTYHDVTQSRSQPGAVWFDATVGEFEAQLNWLAARGARPLSLEALYRHLTLGTAVPEGAVVLTFDDGYAGVYERAFPILQRHGYPFAVFPHTDRIGDRSGYHPKLSWDQLLEMEHSGLATVGAHTASHPENLARLSPEAQDRELRVSKALLERRLNHTVPYLSYPNGVADDAVVRRAKAAGYQMAFLERWGPVEASPGILQLNRYIHLQLQRGWRETWERVPRTKP